MKGLSEKRWNGGWNEREAVALKKWNLYQLLLEVWQSFIINLHKYYTTHKYNKIKYRVNVKIVEGGEEQETVLCKRVFDFVSFSSIFNL